MSLNTAACSELAAYLNLPFMGTAGATESKEIDAQTGAEITSQILFSALSGAGLVHDVGFLDCADIGSLELLVLADEVIAYVKRILRGIDVRPETIMLELIEKVGPGGQFLAEPESVALCRQEIWVPKLFDRQPFVSWKDKGKLSLAERTHRKVGNILRSHQPPALEESVLDQIEAILAVEETRAAAGC
jgi:trimethylamine--corrinoid protein Co-methyltransferase